MYASPPFGTDYEEVHPDSSMQQSRDAFRGHVLILPGAGNDRRLLKSTPLSFGFALRMVVKQAAVSAGDVHQRPEP